jgi:hypothetical protein
MLSKLKTINNNLKPDTVITDCEKASINPLKTVFSDIKNKGCFLHFKQSFYRKFACIGLKAKYGTDLDFFQKLKMLPASSFVPPLKVVLYYEELIESEFNFMNEEAAESKEKNIKHNNKYVNS